jgi:TPR repeat protein
MVFSFPASAQTSRNDIVASYREGCEQRDLDDCHALGIALRKATNQTAMDVAKDYTEANRLFMRGCDAGHADSCASVALALHNGEGFARDDARAYRMAERVCDEGAGSGCRVLGIIENYDYSVAAEIRDAKALALFERACDMGDGDGCWRVADMYSMSETEHRQMVPLYRKACDLSYARGCSSLAIYYEYGEGGDQDIATAYALYVRACNSGENYSCGEVARLHPDPGSAAAVALQQTECDRGHKGACAALALAYETGSSAVTKDLARAQTLYGKACGPALSEKASCKKAEHLAASSAQPKPSVLTAPAPMPGAR